MYSLTGNFFKCSKDSFVICNSSLKKYFISDWFIANYTINVIVNNGISKPSNKIIFLRPFC